VVSPLSIAAALALALAGATGESAAELTRLLRIPEHAEVARLSQGLLGDEDKAVTLKVASSIWLHRTIKDEYEATVRTTHKAVAAALPSTYAPMNAWVSDATEGKITNLLEGSPDALVRAVLVNAVYFKGSWAAKFDPSLTREGTFAAARGASVPAQFMRTLQGGVGRKLARTGPASPRRYPRLRGLGGLPRHERRPRVAHQRRPT